MAGPTSSTTVSRRDLGRIAYEYMTNGPDRGFVGTQILPYFRTDKYVGEYPVIPTETLLYSPDTLVRAPGASYATADWEFEMKTYTTQDRGFVGKIDDTIANMYEYLIDFETITIMRNIDIVMRDQERRIAAAVMNTANVPNTHDVTTEWSNVSTATPRSDVKTGSENLRNANGVVIDSMAISRTAFLNLLDNHEFRDYVKYTSATLLLPMETQKRLMAQYLNLDNIVVGGGQYNSAGLGLSFSLSGIWSNEYALLYKSAQSPNDIMEPSLGRVFVWTGETPGEFVTESWRDEDIRCWKYRIRAYTGINFIFGGAGYLLGNITA